MQDVKENRKARMKEIEEVQGKIRQTKLDLLWYKYLEKALYLNKDAPQGDAERYAHHLWQADLGLSCSGKSE